MERSARPSAREREWPETGAELIIVDRNTRGCSTNFPPPSPGQRREARGRAPMVVEATFRNARRVVDSSSLFPARARASVSTHPTSTMAEETETFAFQAEINQLLSLIINVRRPNPAPRFPAKTIRGATIAPSTRHSRRRSKIRPAHAPQRSKLTPISLFPAADLLLQQGNLPSRAHQVRPTFDAARSRIPRRRFFARVKSRRRRWLSVAASFFFSSDAGSRPVRSD